ncbi:hypothetical protein ACFX13_001662 [Malus domestica]
MTKTKSKKKAAHATPSDDKTLQAVQATPSDDKTLQAAHATPSDDKTLQAAQATPSDDKTLQAAHATPSDDKTLQAVQATPSDDKTLQAAHATPSDDKTLQTVQATPSDVKTLEEIMQIRPWEGDQPADIHQTILRGLIRRVALLEKHRITHGVLNASQIIYTGSKVTIENEPQQQDVSRGCFREQIKTWVSKIFHDPPTNVRLEYDDFLIQIQNAGDNFNQLESHPFLLSYGKKAYFLSKNVMKLETDIKGWRGNYEKEAARVVNIYDLISGEEGYSEVYEKGSYKNNALGALLYSRNVVAHIPENFKDNKKPSKRQVGKRLSEIFPEMMLDLYKFMVKNGIDTRDEPGTVKLDKYFTTNETPNG